MNNENVNAIQITTNETEGKSIITGSVPYVVVESIMNRNDNEKEKMREHYNKDKKRSFIIIIILIIAFILTNGCWIYYWNQYDYSTEETVTVDGKDGGNASYIGDNNNGKVIYGEGDSKENKKSTEKIGNESRNENQKEEIKNE